MYKTVLYSFSFNAGLKNERIWEMIRGNAKTSPDTSPHEKARLRN
jgi:hypothetical protein